MGNEFPRFLRKFVEKPELRSRSPDFSQGFEFAMGGVTGRIPAAALCSALQPVRYVNWREAKTTVYPPFQLLEVPYWELVAPKAN